MRAAQLRLPSRGLPSPVSNTVPGSAPWAGRGVTAPSRVGLPRCLCALGRPGFNIHGNFIVVESRPAAADGRTLQYINEGGAGWVRSAPMYMAGDVSAMKTPNTCQDTERLQQRAEQSACSRFQQRD